jgi:hypothetical protein
MDVSAAAVMAAKTTPRVAGGGGKGQGSLLATVDAEDQGGAGVT